MLFVSKRALLLGVAAATLISQPALAEPPIGTRLGSNQRASAERLTEEQSARNAHATAACMVNKRRAAVERLLAAADVTAMEKAHASIWAGELTCYSGFDDSDLVLGRRIDWSVDLMRGLLAEQMLGRRKGEVAALPTLAFRQGRYERPWFALSGRSAAIDEMGACIADTDPSAIIGLLATAPYSAQEKAAFGGLMPSMGRCLAIGAKLTGNRQALRAALSDALYQRLINPAASLTPVETVKN